MHSLTAAIERAGLAEVERAIAVLDPLVTDERRERMLVNTERRIGAITLLLDSFHDPHNGAAIIRTCDAFAIQRIHAIERWEPFLAARSVTRGSEQWVDVIAHRTTDAALARLHQGGFRLIATHPDGELYPDDLANITEPFALVLGNERDGITPELAARCERSVRIPMRGYAESLNVSVTAAILLHAATKSRPGDLSLLERRRLHLRGLVQTLPRAHEILAAKEAALEAAETQA